MIPDWIPDLYRYHRPGGKPEQAYGLDGDTGSVLISWLWWLNMLLQDSVLAAGKYLSLKGASNGVMGIHVCNLLSNGSEVVKTEESGDSCAQFLQLLCKSKIISK